MIGSGGGGRLNTSGDRGSGIQDTPFPSPMGRRIRQGLRLFPFDGFFVSFPSWSYENWPGCSLVASVFFFLFFTAVIPLYPY